MRRPVRVEARCFDAMLARMVRLASDAAYRARSTDEEAEHVFDARRCGARAARRR